MNAGAIMRWCGLLAAVALWMFAASIAQAEFVLVDNFEDLDLGPISGQDGWYASSSTTQVVTIAGEGDNQSVNLMATPSIVRKALTVPEGETRMLFLRFRYVGQHNYSFGLSHLSAPTEFSDFGPELRKRAAFDEFSIHDGTKYTELATLTPGTWYNLWALVDNANDTTQVWMHARPGEDALGSDQLDSDGTTVFNFRTSNNTDLRNFYIKAADGGSGNDPLWIDDIYLETTGAVNLSNPIPEPGVLGLLASALLVVLYRRR